MKKVNKLAVCGIVSILSVVTYTACDSPRPTKQTAVTNVGAEVCLKPSQAAKPEEPEEVALLLATPEEGTWNGGVQQVYQAKCAFAGCHVAGFNFGDFSTFAGASGAGPASIARVNNAANPMPPANSPNGALSDEEKDILQTWANAGFPEVLELNDPSPAEGDVTYWGQVKDLIDRKCISCHNTGQTAPDLSSFEALKADFNGRSAAQASSDTIIGGTMPPDVPITADPDLNLLQNWIDADMPEGTNPGTEAGGSEAGEAEGEGESSDSADAQASDGSATNCVVGDSDTLSSEVSADAEPTVIQSEAMNQGDLQAALYPEEFNVCLDQGNLFDRRQKACHSAAVDKTYTCNWDGAKQAMSAVPGSADQFDALAADGWQVDQCGKEGETPVIMLVKPSYNKIDNILDLGVKIIKSQKFIKE